MKKWKNKIKRFNALFLAMVIIGGFITNCNLLQVSGIHKQNNILENKMVNTTNYFNETEMSGKCGENLIWTLAKDRTLTISGTGMMDNWSQGDRASWDGYSIKVVKIEDGVESIGECAFYDCTDLIRIEIPSSVMSIGAYAFDGCSSLEEIELPSGITRIEDGVFAGCEQIVKIKIPSDVINIGKHAFMHCSRLSEVELPSGITDIADNTFFGCGSLKEIELPVNVRSIGNAAFFYCNNLRSIKIWNPDCEINNNACIPSKAVIYGLAGSTAQAYGEAHGNSFVIIDEQTDDDKEFYLSITGNALVGKELMLTGSLTIFDETENNNFDSFINSITLQSSDSDIIDVSDIVCKGVAERLGSKVSISLNFTVVPKKAGTVTLTAVTEDGKKAAKEIIVEPELIGSSSRSINKKSVLAVCFVELDEPDRDYLEKFMSSLVVENATEHYGIDFSTDYRILDNGLSANLIMTIDPSNSFDGLYTFKISSPEEQAKEIKIYCAVGNHFWSDEDNQITTEDVIMSKAEKEYLAAFDDFIDKTHGVIEKNADKVTESVDNLADFIKKEYGAEITRIPSEMEKKGWDNYLYEALSSKIADIANAKMSDISYSTDAVTLGANIVKALFNDYKYINDSIEYKDKDGRIVAIEMSIQAIYGAFSGQVVCSNAQNPSERYDLAVGMTPEHTDKVIKQYAKDLAKLGASAANSIYYAMAEDLLGKSLKDFTADFLKKYAAKYGNKLAELGIGGLIDFCSTGYDIYKNVNTFSKTLSKANAIEIRDQLKDSKKVLDSFWDNANDKNIKRASGKIVKATEKILLLWEEYITTGTVTSYDGIKGFVQSIFSCPVSISVYDANGKEIGYVGDDDIWYDDSISIREQGDAKIIDTPFDEQISFRMSGTGHGTLSCAFEEYDKNGNTIGRLNYYNISLSPDTEITATLPSENLIAEHSDMAIYVDGNAVLADKCISAEEYKDAGISVTLKTNNVDGGIVYGAGNYILGNAVNLIALSNEGYIFTGWYDENDVLVSAKRNIEFTALNNINYTAHFDSISDDSSNEDAKDVLVQSILIQQSAVMQNGDKIQFDAKVLPQNAANKTLSWTSNNPSVAVVDNNGLVTAVSAGEATITVLSTDGSNVSASCVITVTKPDNDTPSDDNNNTGDNTGGNGSNNGNSGGNNSAGDNTSGGGTTGGSSSGGGSSNGGSSGGTTGGNQSGGSSGGNSSGNGTDNSNGNPSGDNNKPGDSMQVKLLYYIIEFNANGGTRLSRNTMTLLNDDNLGILPKVQRENCIFNGWYTQKSGGTKVSSSTVLNAGTTLFAQWTKVDKPSKVKAPTLKSQKVGQLAVSFQKIAGAEGYEIAYSTNKKFPSSSAKKTVSASAKETLKKLKSGKKYYVRVRAYKLDSTGKKIYGAYSKAVGRKVK